MNPFRESWVKPNKWEFMKKVPDWNQNIATHNVLYVLLSIFAFAILKDLNRLLFRQGKKTMDNLRTEKQIGGWRHFIGKDEIHCGDLIEVLRGDDWIAGRYEAQGLSHPTTTPIACLEIDETNYFKLQDGMLARLR